MKNFRLVLNCFPPFSELTAMDSSRQKLNRNDVATYGLRNEMDENEKNEKNGKPIDTYFQACVAVPQFEDVSKYF